MKPWSFQIRLHRAAKAHLATLKERAGLRRDDVVCQWALSVSLSTPELPKIRRPQPGDVDVDWHGEHTALADVYAALVERHAQRGGVDPSPDQLWEYLRAHLQRGLELLVERTDDVIGRPEELLAAALQSSWHSPGPTE